jgi:hypothetical protein
LKSQRELALENLALRQQLAVLRRTTKRPELANADRAFWVALSRLWPDWQHALILVKPETVVGWHRKGFKLYWTWKSRNRSGRPRIDPEIRSLIRRAASPLRSARSLTDGLHPTTNVELELRALRAAQADALPGSRFSSVRQRRRGLELPPLRRLRGHGGYDLATADVLRNDNDASEKACSMCSGKLVTDASGEPVFCDDCWYALSCD